MTSSYNGWPADPNGAAIGVAPFSVAGSEPFGNGGWAGGVKAGDVAAMLGYVANRLHAEVEPMMTDPTTGQIGYGCWGFNYRANANNPNNLSNHSSGTAIDFNAPRHPNGARNTFTSAQVKIIRDILACAGGSVEWGGDYKGTPDEMHFDIRVNASALARAVAGLPGGGGTPPTPEPEPPPLEGCTMPLIVKRADEGPGIGLVDYAWSDDLRVIIRIPTLGFYTNLQATGFIAEDHGTAEVVGLDVVQWLRGQVTATGGCDYRPEMG